MLATRAADNQTVLIYANVVGGQDGLIFDGGGFVFQNGRLVLDAPRFREGWAAAIVDLDRTSRLRMENTTWRTDCEDFRLQRLDVPVHRLRRPHGGSIATRLPGAAGRQLLPARAAQTARVDPRDEALDDLFEALALGRRRLLREDRRVHDRSASRSPAAATRCSRCSSRGAPPALIKGRRAQPAALITAFYMPSRHSQATTRTAAHTLAEELGVELRTDPDRRGLRARARGDARRCSKGGEPTELTRQNVQARLRGQRMWNWANSSGALFLQTGDMSEKAVGYTTMGGDLEGALSVIANVPKTVVVRAARAPAPTLPASRASRRRSPPIRARSSPTRRWPKTS